MFRPDDSESPRPRAREWFHPSSWALFDGVHFLVSFRVFENRVSAKCENESRANNEHLGVKFDRSQHTLQDKGFKDYSDDDDVKFYCSLDFVFLACELLLHGAILTCVAIYEATF